MVMEENGYDSDYVVGGSASGNSTPRSGSGGESPPWSRNDDLPAPVPVRVPVRKGKWTPEEEAFTSKIIQEFTLGHLSIPSGTTLRSYLSEKLHCDPMRITKKFAGAACIGKRVYQQCERTPENLAAMRRAEKELAEMEAVFLGRVEAPRTARKPASPRVRAAPARGGGVVGAPPQQRCRSESPDSEDNLSQSDSGRMQRPAPSHKLKRENGHAKTSPTAGACNQCGRSTASCRCEPGVVPMDEDSVGDSDSKDCKYRSETWPPSMSGVRSFAPRPAGGTLGAGNGSQFASGKPPRAFKHIPELSAISDADAGGLLIDFFRSVHAKCGSGPEEVLEGEATGVLNKLHPLLAAKGGSVSTPALSAFREPFRDPEGSAARPPKRQKSLECMLSHAIAMEQH